MNPDDEYFFDTPGSLVAAAVHDFPRPPPFHNDLWKQELYTRLSYLWVLGLLADVGVVKPRAADGFDGPWHPGLRSEIIATVAPKEGWEERLENSTALKLTLGSASITL